MGLKDLPSIPVPAGEELTKAADLYKILDAWKAKGSRDKATSGALIQSSMYGAGFPEFFQRALGSVAQDFFTTAEYAQGPVADSYVPRQACSLIWASLHRTKAQFEEAQDAEAMTAIAQQSFAVIVKKSTKGDERYGHMSSWDSTMLEHTRMHIAAVSAWAVRRPARGALAHGRSQDWPGEAPWSRMDGGHR